MIKAADYLSQELHYEEYSSLIISRFDPSGEPILTQWLPHIMLNVVHYASHAGSSPLRQPWPVNHFVKHIKRLIKAVDRSI
ncbi:MAG: hypothetical protein MUP70_06035 [Candidatus Aminicenantes bacterium]|nr:hypothetical protein [Candidatus Aminicenantes bacterium]